ncbi:MAG: hypothetical protein MRJ93_14055 [Nitrososphaeraceae archaeon]|nr:hypothetical protein [Nitrososphaeraceae archaeon]
MKIYREFKNLSRHGIVKTIVFVGIFLIFSLTTFATQVIAELNIKKDVNLLQLTCINSNINIDGIESTNNNFINIQNNEDTSLVSQGTGNQEAQEIYNNEFVNIQNNKNSDGLTNILNAEKNLLDICFDSNFNEQIDLVPVGQVPVIPDLAVANLGDDDVSILFGDGNGGFSEAAGSPFMVGDAPVSVTVGSFNPNSDEFLDLAVANLGDDDVSILLGDGNGGFSEAVGSPFMVGIRPTSVAVGSFNPNTDDFFDLTVVNGGDDDVSILLGDGNSGFSEAAGSPFMVGDAPVSVAVGSFNPNSDEFLDLAVA